MRKLKVLWISDLVTPTGFGRVANSILKFLGNKLDFKGIGVNYHGDPHTLGLDIYPAMVGGDILGVNRIKSFARFEPDIIFILNDVWVIDKYLTEIKEVFAGKMPKIVCYIPVDAESHSSEWYSNFDIVTVPVAYTEFGKSVILEAAPQLESRIKIIPHGVDTEIFYEIAGGRAEARRKLFGANDRMINSFIFLNANRNQPRKRLDITMRAFAEFAKDKPDNVLLYMHCGVTDSSIDVPKLAIKLGIDNRLILTNLNRGAQKESDVKFNLIYNACDVGVNTSMGEGWGLTPVEHSAMARPQIVGNFSSSGELFKDCGYLVNTSEDFMFDGIMTVGKLLSVNSVAKAMEDLYTNKELYSKLALAGFNKFTSTEYKWSTIADTWYSLFESVVADENNMAQ